MSEPSNKPTQLQASDASLADKIRFLPKKEGRESYYVEYRPPNDGERFATLQLVFTAPANVEIVVQFMEREATSWFRRYPVPVMVSSFDMFGDLCRLEVERDSDHLFAVFSPDRASVLLEWRLLKTHELSEIAIDRDFLLKTYADFDYRKTSEIQAEAKRHAKELKLIGFVSLVWFGFVPIVVVIVEFFIPQWLVLIILFFSVAKGIVNILKLTGKWPKSRKELQKEEELQKSNHYRRHCESNPQGFERLKLENFRRWEQESIQEEAAALRNASQ
ncbi:MAG: hypothetical protein QM775_05000 [Pirellulales bacterium]